MQGHTLAYATKVTAAQQGRLIAQADRTPHLSLARGQTPRAAHLPIWAASASAGRPRVTP